MFNIEDPTDVLFSFITVIIIIVVLYVSISVSFSGRVRTNLDYSERYATESAYALLNSNLSENGLIVWDRVKNLESEEPVFGCDYGTHTIINILKTSTQTDNSVVEQSSSFGYTSDEDPVNTAKFPIGIIYENKIYPGKMIVNVYHDTGSLVTCIIKRAFDYGQAEINISVGQLQIKNCDDDSTSICITKVRPTLLLKNYKYRRKMDIIVRKTSVNGFGTLTATKNGNHIEFSWARLRT